MVLINGKNTSADGKTVRIYFDGDKPVALKSIDGSNISEIEINGDVLEVVSFVGGG